MIISGKGKMIEELDEKQKQLEKDISDMKDTIQQLISKYSDLDCALEAFEQSKNIMTKIVVLQEKQDLYHNHEKCLDFNQHFSQSVNQMKKDFSPF
jgi:uncharacterized protein YoxC